MLYTFTKLRQYLDGLGFPQSNQRGVQVIRKDVTEEERAGRLVFRKDGIYLNVDGKEYKGYMYLKYKVKIHEFGLPKFHITDCSKVKEEREKGTFQNRYYWHNSNVVAIEDRPSGREVKNQTLKLCNYCRRESDISQYSTTEEFHSLLDLQDMKDPTEVLELDMFGRPLDWEKISKAYRIERNFCCENCGFGGSMLMSRMDRSFIHVDHIVAWELWNMKRNNLRCLCILCHSEKDDFHRKKFSAKGKQIEIRRFIDKYKQCLVEIKNPFLKKYI